MCEKTVLKTGPDRSVRPVQSEPVASPIRLILPKPVENRAKTGVEPEIKKNGLMFGSVFKTMVRKLF